MRVCFFRKLLFSLCVSNLLHNLYCVMLSVLNIMSNCANMVFCVSLLRACACDFARICTHLGDNKLTLLAYEG